MDKYQAIEERLHSLMPAALSDEAQARLEDQIDQLSGVEPSQASSNKEITLKILIKAAAVIVLTAIPFLMKNSKLDTVAASGKISDLVVVNSTNRMEGMSEDGLVYPDDGSAPYFLYRFEVSNEEQLRDAYTGTVITVSQPSYEVVTIPQTVF